MANTTTSSGGNQIQLDFIRNNRPHRPQGREVDAYLPSGYAAPAPASDIKGYLSASVRPENEMGWARKKVGRVGDPTARESRDRQPVDHPRFSQHQLQRANSVLAWKNGAGRDADDELQQHGLDTRSVVGQTRLQLR